MTVFVETKFSRNSNIILHCSTGMFLVITKYKSEGLWVDEFLSILKIWKCHSNWLIDS